MMPLLPITALLFSGGLDPVRTRMAIAKLRKSLRTHQLQTLSRVVAVDFLHIELAHEVDGFLGDDLARHHDRETRRIRDHETGGDEVGAVFQTTVDLGIAERDILASRGIICRIEAGANVTFVRLATGIATETGMEMREVR